MTGLHAQLATLLRPAIMHNAALPDVPAWNDRTWNALFERAARHGITALIFDTVQRLPPDRQPPRAVKLRWALSVEAIEARYGKQARIAHELTSFFAEHNIRTVILKGLGLSSYYPEPAHRECGDIDLWLDDYDRGNRLLEEAGIRIDYDHEKHAVFHYKGVVIENHNRFLTASHRPTERIVADFLTEEIRNCHPVPDGYYTPSATFNAIFLLRHMSRHFGTEGINLRQLADWGLFLRSNREKIDFERIYPLYVASGYDTIYDLFTELAGELIGEDFSTLLLHTPDRRLKQRVDLDISRFGEYRIPSKNRLLRFCRKCRKMFSCRWKYERLLPENFWRDIVLPSLRYHFIHPRKI